MVWYLIVKLHVCGNNKYCNFKLCRVHTCLPDLVITISVPTAEKLCHSSAWFSRKLGAFIDAAGSVSSSRRSIPAAESDPVIPPVVPDAAAGKGVDAICSRLKRQTGRKCAGSYMSAMIAVIKTDCFWKKQQAIQLLTFTDNTALILCDIFCNWPERADVLFNLNSSLSVIDKMENNLLIWN